MRLTGFHLLLTYQCTFECDHCFVWGSPWQSGVMSLDDIQLILQQARELRTVESIYFEGGEPFLYYSTLLSAVSDAAQQGFEVGVVTNAYWAISEADALAALTPFAGLLNDLSVSSDLFHWDEPISRQVRNAQWAAERLGIPAATIQIAGPQDPCAEAGTGQIQPGESSIMYRGRAAVKLADQVVQQPWEEFTECPFENLRDPGRVHIDPLGNVHLCQGILLGNLFQTPVKEIWAGYAPERHPVAGPLLAGGPVELAKQYRLAHQVRYADACHFCYDARQKLRRQLPEVLGPDQMYGVDK